MGENTYDVVIIGAGVTGAAVARELSRLKLHALVLERAEDVCSGTSKANSAIVHAGYDAMPGTMKAKMNVRGAELIRELSHTLDFPYRQNGSMILCFREEDKPKLTALYERGLANGVKEMRIISGEEARELEPALSKEVVAALLVPTGGIVCPFNLTIALAENAADNGVEFRFLTEVTDIQKDKDAYLLRVQTSGRASEIRTRYVVNASGVYADKFHNMVSEHKIHITARKGEYVLMDKEAGTLVSHTIFQLPNELGKGVLVTPTVHGNLLVGPDAVDLPDKEDTETTLPGMDDIKKRALQSVPDIPYRQMITGFAGLRAHEDGDDFILGEPEDAEGFFDAAGIESPGLSSAPAIGEYLAGLIQKKGGFQPKEQFISERKGFIEVAKLPMEERNALIRKNPKYGTIVCRCEQISEGEILDAIHRTLGATSLDGIKRRVRQGMGRCQAGFCTPRTMEILSRELGIPMEKVCKNQPGSEMIKG
ncbi:NAD(P)/FAD-dependent oxidoreductase [Oribacterium sp. HCP28S3_H8]|uniref:NAD(P)/FAD-dependent oxidoreductase n=1 Tax=Oribacterium sp. HCP28S3_H8 TaxID=3438945 RepID=UPI003F886ACC